MKSPVPQFTNSLRCLSAILKKAESHCDERDIKHGVLLTARLYPDMQDLIHNVLFACDTAKGLAARLSQTENPVFKDDETSFDELQARITKTIEFMESVPADAFEGAENRDVLMKFGPQEATFSGSDYFTGFAIPNFYFHMATSYDILRHNGVALGKRDFLQPPQEG